MGLQAVEEVDQEDTAQLLCSRSFLWVYSEWIPWNHIQLLERLLLRIDARISQQQRVKLAAHIIDSSAVLILLIDVLLVRKQQIQEPRMELLVE